VEITSHYYAMLAFARVLGYNKQAAETIAYVSQYVDDALADFITVKHISRDIEYDIINNQNVLSDMATCQDYVRVKTLTYTSMIRNTAAFHYVPKCKGSTFARKMRCGENSPVIREILEKSLKEDNLVKLGMLLHIYTDTYSHQGFSGIFSEVNDISNVVLYNRLYIGWMEKVIIAVRKMFKPTFERLFDYFIPVYGHSQALIIPDETYIEWSYQYDSGGWVGGITGNSGRINNSERYKLAFENVCSYLKRYLKVYKKYADEPKENLLKECFKILVQPASRKNKIRMWQDFYVRNGLYDATDRALSYDAELWMKSAFASYETRQYSERIIENAVLAENFKNTEWYSFYTSVRWYKKEFLNVCKKFGLNINV
jgi:hypothetical protein